jgi:hypothetical protein
MEIKDLTTFFVDKEANIIDVTFRLIGDSDDVIRQDQIDFDLTEEYGYSILPDYPINRLFCFIYVTIKDIS